MKTLVTGGCGFIGSHLTKQLLSDGHQVIVVDDLSAGRRSRLPEHPKLLVMERSVLWNNLPYFMSNVDTVYHLAARPRVQRSIKEPMETHTVNATGTLAVLLAARDAKVRRVVFSSSSSVYGDQATLPLVETMVPNPMSPYALQKLIGERYCQLFSQLYGLETVILRYFNVYGPDMDPNDAYANLMPKFLISMQRGIAPTIYGDGEQRRDFTYVGDVVWANLLATKSYPAAGEVFNIGSGKSYSVNEVAEALSYLAANWDASRIVRPVHGPPVPEPRQTCADVSKAARLLNWTPVIGLADGLKTLDA